MRIHTGEKPFQCQYCPYTTTQKGSLRIHIRKHTGEKPFACPLCEYRSATKGNLKAHQAVHQFRDSESLEVKPESPRPSERLEVKPESPPPSESLEVKPESPLLVDQPDSDTEICDEPLPVLCLLEQQSDSD